MAPKPPSDLRQVVVWISRKAIGQPGLDGEIEQHVGPFARYERGPNGRALMDPNGDPVFDAVYASAVLELLEGFNGRDALEVAEAITPKALKADKTGALRGLGVALAEIATRVETRNRRGDRGTMREPLLANYELSTMIVHVRPE
jgi:hypothetical protein